jgi:hypothetical protein
MITLDLKKEMKFLYSPPSKTIQVVTVPRQKYVMLDGQIEPDCMPGNSPSFGEAIQAMYGAAYTLKFASKQRKDNPIDFPVMALEGLWWTDSGAYDLTHPDGWKYTLLIFQPEHITPAMFEDALTKLRKKQPGAMLERLRLEEFEEGRCVQVMHLGPYKDEPATLQRMDDFAAQNGFKMHGKHHEIYLGDPRRAKPENMKTVLRHPIE